MSLKRIVMISLVLTPLFLTNNISAQAACNTYSNNLSGQSGTCDGVRINTYGNNLGGVSGTIGNSRINTYGNNLGGVSGTIGNSHINTYGNNLGGVSGSGLGGVPGITSSSKTCASSYKTKC